MYEMPNDGEPLAEDRVLELLKSSLESTETDGLYELKTNHNIIDSALLKISNKIKEKQTSKN